MAEAKPFSEWTAKEAQEAAGGAVSDTAKTAARFIEGDHWQNGDGWTGPRPQSGSDGASIIMAEIQKAFTSRNAIAEVTGRHSGGVVGREPAWSLSPRRPMKDGETPTDQEQALIDEAEAALTAWWDERNMARTIYHAVFRLLFAGRSQTRIYVPPGLLDAAEGEGGQPVTVIRARDLADALSKLYVAVPDLGMSTVVTDPRTQRQVGIYVEQGEGGKVTAELTYLGDVPDARGVYPTIIRTIAENADAAPAALPLGGRLTIYEATRDPLITEQVMQSQRALNLALSMLPRNVVTGGFLERVITNGMVPGKWVDDPDVAGGKRYEPADYKTGPGTTNFITGVAVEDPTTGKQTVASPGVQWREPISVQSSVDAKTEHYADILGECQQAHVLLGSEATPSGRSRAEARADYASSLDETARVEERRGRWLLETALAMAEAILGTPGKYTDALRVVYTVRVNAGPVDPEEQAQIQAQVDGGLRSKEGGQSAIGIADVDAENAVIASQPGASLDLVTRQAAAMDALMAVGVSLEAAAKLVGMTDEQVAILVETQTDVTPAAPRTPPAPPAPGPESKAA